MLDKVKQSAIPALNRVAVATTAEILCVLTLNIVGHRIDKKKKNHYYFSYLSFWHHWTVYLSDS